MSLFTPDATFTDYHGLSAEYLSSRGVRLLLCDIDNTLAPYEQPICDDRIRAWIGHLQNADIRVAFLSNNDEPRVALFNETLGLPYRRNARKPLTRRARKLMRTLGFKAGETAFLGDQIFTDVLCARLCGARAYLVPPIKDRTDRGTRLKRWFERGILGRYFRKHPDQPDIRKQK